MYGAFWCSHCLEQKEVLHCLWIVFKFFLDYVVEVWNLVEYCLHGDHSVLLSCSLRNNQNMLVLQLSFFFFFFFLRVYGLVYLNVVCLVLLLNNQNEAFFFFFFVDQSLSCIRLWQMLYGCCRCPVWIWLTNIGSYILCSWTRLMNIHWYAYWLVFLHLYDSRKYIGFKSLRGNW